VNNRRHLLILNAAREFFFHQAPGNVLRAIPVEGENRAAEDAFVLLGVKRHSASKPPFQVALQRRDGKRPKIG